MTDVFSTKGSVSFRPGPTSFTLTGVANVSYSVGTNGTQVSGQVQAGWFAARAACSPDTKVVAVQVGFGYITQQSNAFVGIGFETEGYIVGTERFSASVPNLLAGCPRSMKASHASPYRDP